MLNNISMKRQQPQITCIEAPKKYKHRRCSTPISDESCAVPNLMTQFSCDFVSSVILRQNVHDLLGGSTRNFPLLCRCLYLVKSNRAICHPRVYRVVILGSTIPSGDTTPRSYQLWDETLPRYQSLLTTGFVIQWNHHL